MITYTPLVAGNLPTQVKGLHYITWHLIEILRELPITHHHFPPKPADACHFCDAKCGNTRAEEYIDNTLVLNITSAMVLCRGMYNYYLLLGMLTFVSHFL